MHPSSPTPSSSLRAAWLTWLLPLALGCSNESQASTAADLVEPPYQISADAPDRLRVRPDLARKLKAIPVGISDVEAQLTGYGRLGFAVDAAYSIRTPFPSYVERVLVEPGDQVKVGQPLAELRSSDLARLRAELARNQVQIRVERQAVERLRPLVEDGTASERELAEATARVEVAEAELASARQALSAIGSTGGSGERYVLRASAEGSVVRRNIAPGERVDSDSEPAFLIGDPNRLVVRASFPDRDALSLKEDASCAFTVHALGNARFEGTLTRVLGAIDARTRSIEAICSPKEQGNGLRSEMLARVDVHVQGEGRLLVPRSALLMKRDQWLVFVRTDETTLERRAVRPGITLGDRVQIDGGLTSGEQVIVQGAVLFDGELDVLL